jgi:phosphoribosylformylglycinamidine synthase PurS subunit
MQARILVTLRRGVLDPAGQGVRDGLHQLGFEDVREVRLGKVLEVELDDMAPGAALARLEAMAEQLLANAVIEDFRIEL